MSAEVRIGDALTELALLDAESVHCCITSPPYFGLRDYGNEAQIGLEATPDEYVARLVEVFREVKRVLRDDGTLWLNLGDSYNNRSVARPSSHQGGLGFENESIKRSWAEQTEHGMSRLSLSHGGLKEKDLLGVPWMVAFALRADGWYLRSEIIWAKPACMPESIKDRPTKSHEQVFLLSKSPSYYYDMAAIREPFAWPEGPWGQELKPRPGVDTKGGNQASGEQYNGYLANGGRNKRSVWTVALTPYPEAHFATFPPKLIEPMVLAGCPREACVQCGAAYMMACSCYPTGRVFGPGVVLDPFAGSGTTLQVAVANGRNAIGIELNPDYAALAERRLAGVTPSMFDVEAA